MQLNIHILTVHRLRPFYFPTHEYLQSLVRSSIIRLQQRTPARQNFTNNSEKQLKSNATSSSTTKTSPPGLPSAISPIKQHRQTRPRGLDTLQHTPRIRLRVIADNLSTIVDELVLSMRNRTPVICVVLYCLDIRDGGVGGSGCDGEVGTGCTHISRSGAGLVLLIQRLVLLSSQ